MTAELSRTSALASRHRALGSGLEDPRLGQIGAFAAVEVLIEEGELDLLAVELGALGAEADLSETIPVAAGPAATRCGFGESAHCSP